MRKRYVNLKRIATRSKAILSGDSGDVMMPQESEKPFWLDLVRLPTGSCLECQNQNIKAWHHTHASAASLALCNSSRTA